MATLFQASVAAGPDDADRDLAAIGDENLAHRFTPLEPGRLPIVSFREPEPSEQVGA